MKNQALFSSEDKSKNSWEYRPIVYWAQQMKPSPFLSLPYSSPFTAGLIEFSSHQNAKPEFCLVTFCSFFAP